MQSSRQDRGKELFEQALALSKEERPAFLVRACGEDGRLRQELAELLKHHEAASGFLSGAVHLRDEPRELPIERIKLRGYRLERELGRGGMGVVYLAEQESPRRAVAIKFLRLDSVGPEQVARFRREAEILGRLNHPGIAHVHEAGLVETEHGALPWIALEYVRGSSLPEYLAGRTPGLRDLLALFGDLCGAVDHAHQRGVVHRDLKPSNVLVDERGAVRVLDFGVARLLGEGGEPALRTHTGQLVGTLAYASPEQAIGASDAIDARSDVYSLGVMLFELVTGELPYPIDESRLVAAIQTIAEKEPARLRRLRPDAPADLETIVRKALAKERERRYANAGELAADLERLREERPILAQPPTALYQARKFVRRNRVLSASVAAVILALSTGLLLALRGLRAERAGRMLTSETLDALAARILDFAPQLGFGEEQREGLEEIRARIERQLALDPTNRALRVALARSLYELGVLDQARGDHERLRVRADQARAIRAALVEEDPDDLESWTRLSLLYAKLGEASRDLGDEAARDAWFQRALELDQRLVREHPGDRELVEDLGWSLARMVEVAGERGDAAEAQRLAGLRLQDALVLVRAEPDNWKYVYNATSAYGPVTGALWRQGRQAEAEESVREQVRLAQHLVELQPTRREFLHQNILAQRDAMYVAWAGGKTEEACEYAELALTLAVEILCADPQRIQHLDLVRRSGKDAVRLALDAGRSEAAQRAVDRLRMAVRLTQRARAPAWPAGLLAAFTDLAEARVTADDLGSESRALEQRGFAGIRELIVQERVASSDLDDLWTSLEEHLNLSRCTPERRAALVQDIGARLQEAGQRERAEHFHRRIRVAEDGRAAAEARLAEEPDQAGDGDHALRAAAAPAGVQPGPR